MTQDEIIEMAREAGIEWISGLNGHGYHINHPNDLERFAKLVAAKEREACAKVCEAERILGIDDERAYYGELMAAAIRARGQE